MTAPAVRGDGCHPAQTPGEVTVRELLETSPVGPMLDRPVADVLADHGLPSLPVAPPSEPPLPGLPVLPQIDIGMLVRPLTDLLGGFGSGDLTAAGIDPSTVLAGLATILESTMSTGAAAMRALDDVWTGVSATAARARSAQTAADTASVSAQGASMSIDIEAAVGIVGTGLATVQGIVAATIGKIAGVLPLIATPVGQSAAVGFAAEGLAEATAAVAATRARLLAPTAAMTAHGAPVPVTGAPVASGVSPFGTAGTVLEGLTPLVSSMAGLASRSPMPGGQAAASATRPPGREVDRGSCTDGGATAATSGSGADGPVGARRPGTEAPGSCGGVGATMSTAVGALGVSTSASTPSRMPTPMAQPTPLDRSMTPSAGTVTETSSGQAPSARPTSTPVGAVPAAMGALGPGGPRAATATPDHHEMCDHLVSADNGHQMVGDVPDVVPPVMGAAETESRAPDIDPGAGSSGRVG
ncbi:hypothetical protein AAFP35_06140 [Gordonia sp. CPCC 206044]|uniref:hypothetical protein n=1 Tax=Gordonia sp. CPCC 206044 TaxID=3140793 RepID=UPI003AF3913E